MPILVVRTAKGHHVLHPHQVLTHLQPGAIHRGLERCALGVRVSHVHRRARPGHRGHHIERRLQQLEKPTCTIVLDSQRSLRLPHIIDAVGRIGPDTVRLHVTTQRPHAIKVSGRPDQQPMLPQRPQLPRPRHRRLRRRRNIIWISQRLRREKIALHRQQILEPVTGSTQVLDRRQQLIQIRGVVFTQVGQPVVGRHDRARGVLVDVHDPDIDRAPAERSCSHQRVIPGQHLIAAAGLAAPIHHDGPVLAVLGQRNGDCADITAARVACEGVQIIDGKLRVFGHARKSGRG
ncbi:Uncharacterised protein [Mycobacteroides abscessus subsp. abscessus]|nr:Uncharacterised protein [Mycobacteroides abscessus subsp. abscessus]